MPERRDTNLFEILIGQVTQNLVNIILGKALSVLPEPELFEPVRNLLHRRPSSDLALSVLDWHVAEFTNTRQDRVARAPVDPDPDPANQSLPMRLARYNAFFGVG